MEVFKILKGFRRNGRKTFFKTHISNTGGHSINMYKDRVNRHVLKYIFANRVIEQWNKLPEQVSSASSISSFKTKIQKYLIDK
jgi:hypothetical protein